MAGIPRELAEALVSEARPDLPVRGGALRQVGAQEGAFRFPVRPPRPLGPETSWRFFSPARPDVRRGPEAFRQRLHEVDPRLEVVWHPVNERWCVWFRDREGWRFLFPVQYWPSGDYMPLDERTIAKCWDRCGRRWGSGRAYWDRIEREVIRDMVKAEQARQESARDRAADFYDYTEIKVAMRGPSTGSKFANHHSE